MRHRARVPPAPTVPPALSTAPFLGTAALVAGLLTRPQLRGRAWVRLFPDVYVHRDVELTHELRARAAALRWPDAVVTGRSAAALWGVPLAGPAAPVEISRLPGTHPVRVPGVRVRRTEVDGRHQCERAGVWATTREATAVDLAGRLPLPEAVAAVDQLVVAGADLAEVRWLAGTSLGAGCRRARRAVALADSLAESPQETRLRLLIRRSTLPAPVAQHVVRHRGRFVARVDFAWPDRRVALEYDGLWHRDPQQFGDDRDRLNRIQAAGWRVVFVTARDLHRPEALLARIADALASVH